MARKPSRYIRRTRRHNPFAEALIGGIGAGAGFASGSRVLSKLFDKKERNPQEIPWSARDIVYGYPRLLSNPKDFTPEMNKAWSLYWYMLRKKNDPNKMWEYKKAKEAFDNVMNDLTDSQYWKLFKRAQKLTAWGQSNPDDLEVPWSAEHIAGTAQWNPSRRHKHRRYNPADLEVPWSLQHIKGTAMWNPADLEVPWSAEHIKGTAMWNPAHTPRCPIHGNFIRIRRGWRTVTCPVGGETLGVR